MTLAERIKQRRAAGEKFDFNAARQARTAAMAVALEAAAADAGEGEEAPAPATRFGSPASRLVARRLAAMVNAANDNTPAAPDGGARAEPYGQVLIQLDADRRRLKQIQSVETKVEAKREMLANYTPWVRAVLEADLAVQDEVVVTVMIWCIDVGDYVGALDIAEWVLRHNISLPERFARKPATLIAEMIAEAALAALKAGEPFDEEQLLRSMILTVDHDMPDEVRAKQHKALGQMLSASAENPTEEQLQTAGFVSHARAAALKELRRAQQLNPKAGVVKDIERLERELKKEAGQ